MKVFKSETILKLAKELEDLRLEYEEKFPKEKSWKQQLEESIRIYKFLLNK